MPTAPRKQQPAKDDPERSLTPSFTPPPTPPPVSPVDLSPPATPATGPSLPAPQPTESIARRRFLESTAADRADTRTGISSAGEDLDRRQAQPSVADVTGLVVGVLAVVVAAGAWAVKMRSRGARTLRAPSKTQERGVAAPLARIMLRRLDMSMLGPDIGDALHAAAAAGSYLGDGPLLVPASPVRDQGVPANLQEEPES